MIIRTKPISISIEPIGNVVSPLTQKFGIPRQPNLVSVPAVIELYSPYHQADAVKGLQQFSHLWVIWQFHAVQVAKGNQKAFRPLVRPPRLGGNEKVGVFASRSMFRPNQMGMSVVKLEKVEVEQGVATLHISGADMLDGTPVLDIKPYIVYSDSVPEADSGYALEPPQPKAVQWTEQASDAWQQAMQYAPDNMLDKTVVTELIAQDPRPAYHTQTATQGTNQKIKTYSMRYDRLDVVFYANEDTLVICDVVSISSNT